MGQHISSVRYAVFDRIKVLRIHAAGIRRFFGLVFFAVFIGFAGARTALATPPYPLALANPSSQEHHVGKVIFVELVTPDLVTAKQFYAGLFGWTFRDYQTGATQYAQAFLNGYPVAGLVQKSIPAGEHRQPAWLTFFSARDVDAATQLALHEGAKILVEPHTIPGRGREAIFDDPQGAVFAVLAASNGDPPDTLAELGDWIWSSLITSDPEQAAKFYQTLFDYEVFDLPPDPDGAQHLIFASDNYARASANSLSPDHLNAHSHWINYIRVDNADKMAAKVVSLGGRVLLEPRIDRHGGKLAIVADPLGAVFGLLEWPETESKEVPQ